jgi:Fe-Mn family superoxide dismutase
LQLIDHGEDFSQPGWHLLFTPDSPLPPAISAFLQSVDLIVNLICGPKAIFSTRLTSATSPTCPTLFHIEPKPPEGYADHTLQFQASQMGLSLPLLPETSYRVVSDIVLAVREELAVSKIDPCRLVLFHPGASSPAKRWSLDCFCDLITRTRKANRIPGVLLGEVELEQFSSKDISRLKSLAHPFFDWPLEKVVANLEQIPEDIRTAVRNNGGGVYNHTTYWNSMSPNAGGKPSGNLGNLIEKTFGSFDAFKADFEKTGLTRFGSGYAWLSAKKDGSLVIHSTANQDSPIQESMIPLLVVDVWEHAYYLKYQNRRADYLSAWWDIVNWKEAENRYLAIK